MKSFLSRLSFAQSGATGVERAKVHLSFRGSNFIGSHSKATRAEVLGSTVSPVD